MIQEEAEFVYTTAQQWGEGEKILDTEDISWTTNTMGLVKKTQKGLLQRVNLLHQLLMSLFCCYIESVAHGSLVWYGSSSAVDHKPL